MPVIADIPRIRDGSNSNKQTGCRMKVVHPNPLALHVKADAALNRLTLNRSKISTHEYIFPNGFQTDFPQFEGFFDTLNIQTDK
ncbi:hypothetical protein CYPRO_0039 [Cyclonatronum proteinivorum]|uniref:Uncharacterized protein n=1 Tax=Cyclonatronum proteinivorum TaxID=1457365 RepID=A0A345UFS6_9BACT|nr:hypothetical protein CYPRO_0039 [Cyclonatronum proteinivorum]